MVTYHVLCVLIYCSMNPTSSPYVTWHRLRRSLLTHAHNRHLCKPCTALPLWLAIFACGWWLWLYGVTAKHKKRGGGRGLSAVRDRPPLRGLLNYAACLQNVIDLLAILPFYLEQVIAVAGGSITGNVFLDVVRVGRVFRLVKLGR